MQIDAALGMLASGGQHLLADQAGQGLHRPAMIRTGLWRLAQLMTPASVAPFRFNGRERGGTTGDHRPNHSSRQGWLRLSCDNLAATESSDQSSRQGRRPLAQG